MHFNAMQLYSQMQEEMNELVVNCKNEMTMIEGCFTIAVQYCNRIKKHAESHIFSNESEEVYFFKNINPLFIAAIEYYKLYYQAVLFKPSNDKIALAAYWLHQLKRVEIFYTRHKEFYEYYTSGQTGRDNVYFVRSGITGNSPGNSHPYCKAATSHDHIAARILGYKKYLEHVEFELGLLMPGSIADEFRDQNTVHNKLVFVYIKRAEKIFSAY